MLLARKLPRPPPKIDELRAPRRSLCDARPNGEQRGEGPSVTSAICLEGCPNGSAIGHCRRRTTRAKEANGDDQGRLIKPHRYELAATEGARTTRTTILRSPARGPRRRCPKARLSAARGVTTTLRVRAADKALPRPTRSVLGSQRLRHGRSNAACAVVAQRFGTAARVWVWVYSRAETCHRAMRSRLFRRRQSSIRMSPGSPHRGKRCGQCCAKPSGIASWRALVIARTLAISSLHLRPPLSFSSVRSLGVTRLGTRG